MTSLSADVFRRAGKSPPVDGGWDVDASRLDSRRQPWR